MHLKYVSPWDQCVCNCYHISRPSMAILRNSAVSPNFSTIPTMSTNVLLFCALAPFSTLHQTYFDFLEGVATGYPYSWHNVDILIVVTMLNVDTWRRSNVGWQKLSPSMQSTDCSPFHYPPHICIGFCSYLHF